MAKMGRPKSENPMNNRINIRFDDDVFKKLGYVAKEMKLSRTKAIRQLINNEYEKLRKNNG